jgi:hypothetical protein
VVGAGGRILLPAEAGLEQRTRLATEGVRFRGDRIPLGEFGFHFPAAKGRQGRGRQAKRQAPGI